MNIALAFTRIFFLILSVFFMTLYMTSLPSGALASNSLIGIITGALLGALLIGFDLLFRRYNLRSFNIALIGLFIGYLMGQALVLILDAILGFSQTIHIAPQAVEMVKIALFLFGTYLGTVMTLRASDELTLSIPFIKFSSLAQKRKELIIDSSVLSDARVIDLASTGLFDHQLILPRFVVKDLYAQLESSDEKNRIRGKKALDILKKLEAMTDLALRFSDTDFRDIKDQTNKLLKLARLIDGNILSADISRIQISVVEGVRIINLHTLSNALKPLMQTGEQIKIKIQRYGKEPRQGVGYLEDGTMVVVNGGGQYIGEMIEAQVLSVKHTSSGRLIFCNAMDEEFEPSTHFPTDYE